MTRAGRVKSYWSAISNLHKRINLTNSEGRSARKEYYERTGNKKLTEKKFNSNLSRGKSFSKSEVRHFYKIAREQREKQLRKDYKESIKAGNKVSYKEFKKANREPDWEKLQEMFNSPK